jgi:TolB-like protein
MLKIFTVILLLFSGCYHLFAEDSKMKIVLFDLKPISLSGDIALSVSDLLRTSLFKTGLFTILERNQINAIIEEQKMNLSGLTDDEYAAKIGAFLSANKVLVGSVMKLGNSYIINVRIIDVEKGIMEFAENVEVESESKLSAACNELALRLANTINGKNTLVVKDNPSPGEFAQPPINSSPKYTISPLFNIGVPGISQLVSGNNTGFLFLGGTVAGVGLIFLSDAMFSSSFSMYQAATTQADISKYYGESEMWDYFNIAGYVLWIASAGFSIWHGYASQSFAPLKVQKYSDGYEIQFCARF